METPYTRWAPWGDPRGVRDHTLGAEPRKSIGVKQATEGGQLAPVLEGMGCQPRPEELPRVQNKHAQRPKGACFLDLGSPMWQPGEE